MMIPVADQIAPYAGMTLVEELNMSLYTSVGTTCAKSVDCTVWANALQDQACTAAKSYMEIKQALRTEVTFKCKAFRGSDGSKCTIENMFEVSGIYQNDCFVNGTLETMEYNCNLEDCVVFLPLLDFATLVTSFSKQLNRSVQRLDEVTATALVEENLLQPIEHVVEGVTCGFMATMYQDFVDGMCFRGVWGFTAIVASYVASAVLTIFLVILVYFIWRFALDSYEFDMKPLRTPDRDSWARVLIGAICELIGGEAGNMACTARWNEPGQARSRASPQRRASEERELVWAPWPTLKNERPTGAKGEPKATQPPKTARAELRRTG
eukprot:g30421.t2